MVEVLSLLCNARMVVIVCLWLFTTESILICSGVERFSRGPRDRHAIARGRANVPRPPDTEASGSPAKKHSATTKLASGERQQLLRGRALSVPVVVWKTKNGNLLFRRPFAFLWKFNTTVSSYCCCGGHHSALFGHGQLHTHEHIQHILHNSLLIRLLFCQ